MRTWNAQTSGWNAHVSGWNAHVSGWNAHVSGWNHRRIRWSPRHSTHHSTCLCCESMMLVSNEDRVCTLFGVPLKIVEKLF